MIDYDVGIWTEFEFRRTEFVKDAVTSTRFGVSEW
jgi:hypothetical protein